MKVFTETCRDQLSPFCTKTFERVAKRGRPQVNCNNCKAYKTASPRITKSAVTDKEDKVEITTSIRECPCGQKFEVKSGRGRKAEKCETCRSAGTVYRADEDGQLQAVQAETIAEEERKRREEAGHIRAKKLYDLMQPLLSDRRERIVIVR